MVEFLRARCDWGGGHGVTYLDIDAGGLIWIVGAISFRNIRGSRSARKLCAIEELWCETD
jgi:hypothetical protein